MVAHLDVGGGATVGYVTTTAAAPYSAEQPHAYALGFARASAGLELRLASDTAFVVSGGIDADVSPNYFFANDRTQSVTVWSVWNVRPFLTVGIVTGFGTAPRRYRTGN